MSEISLALEKTTDILQEVAALDKPPFTVGFAAETSNLEANARLGLPEEARDFPTAARMLDLLGIEQVRLLTNNLEKVVALEKAGVKVVERVPHQFPANPHNARYLATKRDRMGHHMPDDLRGA